MTLPLFFWLLALTLDASLFLLLLRRDPSPMRWLIGYKVVASLVLLFVRGNFFAPPSWNYVWTYAAYTWILAGLVCWNIQHLADFEPTAVRFALLLSLLAATVSIYCSPGDSLTVTLLRAADRLHWLAPTSLLLWGILEPPPQISRRNSITYFGFSMWAAGELLRSFAKLAGLATPAYAAFYPIGVTAWILAEMQSAPSKVQIGKKSVLNFQEYTRLCGLPTDNVQGYAKAKMRRK